MSKSSPSTSRLRAALRGGQSNWFGLLLRLGALSGKFLLMIYLAKYLSLVDLGVYGLVATTSHLAMYPLGFAFYTFSTRSMLAGDRTELPNRVRDQAIFHGVAYALVLPALVGVALVGIIPRAFLAWFLAIVIVTHLSQELFRLLTVFGHPRSAMGVHFLTNGLWTFPVLLIGVLSPDGRNLTVVLLGWTAGGIFGVCWGVFSLRRNGILKWPTLPIDWAWIGRGVRISSLFFASSAAYKIIERSDRYFIEVFLGTSLVGVYTFFTQITYLLEDLVTTTFIMVAYPRLVEAYQRGRHTEFATHFALFARGTALWGILVTAVLSVGIFPLLSLLGKQEFFHELPTFFLLLLGQLVALAGLVPHYALYAQGRDKPILAATLVATVLAIGLNFVLVPAFGLIGAAIGGTVAFATMAGLKYVIYLMPPTPA